MFNTKSATILLVAGIAVATPCNVTHSAEQGGQHASMPPGMTHEEHMARMKQHGDSAMGFDQDKTTHHFLMTQDGGIISVDANDALDQASVARIREHLREIAGSFKRGDFGKPLETHGEYPDGVAAMKRLKSEISYTYAQTQRGGMVRIVTSDAEALAAVHEFLAYQIREHATGDPLTPADAH